MPELEKALNKLVLLKRTTGGGLGAKAPAARGYVMWRRIPQPLIDFRNFLEKLAILIPLNHILHVIRAVCKN